MSILQNSGNELIFPFPRFNFEMSATLSSMIESTKKKSTERITDDAVTRHFINSLADHPGKSVPMAGRGAWPPSEKQKQLVAVFEMVRLEAFLRHWPGLVGRPPWDRAALVRSFVAKVVFQIKTT